MYYNGFMERKFSAFGIICGWLLAFSGAVQAQTSEPVVTVSAARPETVTGGKLGLWLNVLNTTEGPLPWNFPKTIPVSTGSGLTLFETAATLRNETEAGPVTLAAGTFGRREYLLAVPETWSGEVALGFPGVTSNRLALRVPMVAGATKAAAPGKPESLPQKAKGWLDFRNGLPADHEPQGFFKEHIFGYEPMYFIAGTEAPTAKFQISFKYQILNNRSEWVKKHDWLDGFKVAYTQTSLWDLSAPSTPFFDSSYKPELLYEHKWGGSTNGPGEERGWRFQPGLQAGVQHESNGKNGPDSRSLNIVYFQPKLWLLESTNLMFHVAPRVWTYIVDLDDNPDLADFQGYGDLRLTMGWQRGMQLTTLGRLGDNFNRGSLQLDLTYPLMSQKERGLSLYLHLQYFTGYGESLLQYNQHGSSFRAGLSLYR